MQARTQVTHYNTHKARNTQEELQQLAKNIIAFGEITKVCHQGYGTNRGLSAAADMYTVYNGHRCIIVEGFETTYHIHLNGLKVTEIIETTIAPMATRLSPSTKRDDSEPPKNVYIDDGKPTADDPLRKMFRGYCLVTEAPTQDKQV